MKTKTNTTLILSSSDVRHIVQHFGLNEVMDALIARLLSAFRNFSAERTHIPPRSGFHYEMPHTGLVEWMPLLVNGEEVVIKVVGYHPGNPEKYKLPTIVSTISSYDTATGHLTGIIDGVILTALRTGAASAVASQCLAHPESKVLGIIGCGAQGVSQLHALSRVFHLKKVLIYDADPGVVRSFEDRCRPLNLDATIVPSSIRDVVGSSDILVTATTIDVGAGPLFEDFKTRPWLHVNAVGSDFPGKVELPAGLLKTSFVCPDFQDQAMLEGECQQISPEEVGPGITEVVKDPEKFKPFRYQLSVFDSTGWALEDQVAMELFMEYAAKLGLGQEIEIEDVPHDAKNPYHFLSGSSQPTAPESGSHAGAANLSPHISHSKNRKSQGSP